MSAAAAAAAAPASGSAPLGKKGKAGGAKHASHASHADASTTSCTSSAAAAASSDALMDLLASKIDHLEGASGAAVDEAALTQAEAAAVSARFTELRATLDAEAAEGKPASEQVAALLELYRSEVQSRTVLARQLADARERLTRSANQKRNLENLARELQDRNKKLSAELKVVSVEQSRAHADMKAKFEANLSDIQLQLNRHTEERLAQQKENDKLRDNLASLLKFDSMREEHHQQQLKTKELEAKLAEAKLAQQSDFAVAEAKKAKDQQAKIDALRAMEANLRAQLNGYAEKFEAVQSTLTKSNELFTNFKAEMDKSAIAIKKSEKEKQALAEKYNAAQLNVIQMFEERQAERVELEKLQRQNQVLTSLCKELKSKAQASGTNGPASAPAPVPATEETAAAGAASGEVPAATS